ncbi:LD-carboxypeptidase [Acinetobacter sp. ANC 4648]|uniref:LD-carboxypeptidase n=1 Tax=Acinetobacter sp. ANC 4648 TaxID=1977875 RepID=UPI000A335793|nr:LD-carboxypeptidase [Acinetobacter sp. ANC 4648]OTG83976.1 LD-carboxypeptidase [Acinetobacter sp. ANC 4648]
MHFRVVSPSACVDIEKIQLAQNLLENLGHQVSLSEHVFAQYRYLAGTVEQRILDLKNACLDPTVDAIWCGRGGTGAAELVPYLSDWILKKPIIGYSDSTVLLNYIAMQGGQALHGPVFQEIAVKNLNNEPLSYDALKVIRLLSTAQTTTESNKNSHYALSALNTFAQQDSKLNKLQLLGGNLTVLCSLQGTANALKVKQPSILLLEDVGEPYYRLERSLVQLLQSIDTTQLKAVVLGDFYQCPQKNVPHSITEIFSEHFNPLAIPLYQCNWFGHGTHNRPFWIGQSGSIQDSQLIL